MNIINIYLGSCVIFMIICSFIFFYLVYDTEFKKYDSLTRNWYFGSKEKYHKRLLKKNPEKWKNEFYYVYKDTQWYNEMVYGVRY